MKKKVMIEMDWHELETLAKQHYNSNNYSFVATEECGNDSQHTFTVDGDMDGDDEEAAELRATGKVPMYNNGLLLNCLCADGHIEAGEYIVTVCW